MLDLLPDGGASDSPGSPPPASLVASLESVTDGLVASVSSLSESGAPVSIPNEQAQSTAPLESHRPAVDALFEAGAFETATTATEYVDARLSP